MIVTIPPFDALAVANRFLALAHRDGMSVDHLKLQKLLYCAHGWYLVFTGKPLLSDHVEAWPYGPVIPAVYHQFKSFGNGPITAPALRALQDPFGSTQLVPYELQADKYTDSVLESVWQTYKAYSGLQLSTMTHQAGTAWEKTSNLNQNRTGTDIPDFEIWTEFKQRLDATGRGTTAA